ncbi:hypothetical protein [Thermochromatium tepidum]|jgi:hypothetical protein|uniref:Uncharacterized protein n=1 Tax=Thermochromatium tepidum ATCC 43061 TaxID=316276 RepID=A0A6I6EC64_THETI|nr:hypothetical protein [Thermochromatium tepidum]QGU31750.1 hypothetical protein E6P07_01310 [Thermochromatium tepidum ATCC 43061]
MKELIMLILIAIVAGLGYAFYQGHAHSVTFHYNCNLDIPWYDAIFLDATQCPHSTGH